MADDQPVFDGIEAAIAHYEAPKEDSNDEPEDTSDEDTTEGELIEDQEEDEDEPEESDEDEPEGDDEEEYLFKVGEGEDEVVVKTAEEAKAGYLRQSDYTKKTQALASERKAVEAEQSELMSLKSQYLQGLNQIKMMASEQLSEFAGIDWQQLQKDDPYDFEDKKSAYEAAMLAFQQTTAQEMQLQSEVHAQQLERDKKIRAQEMELLKQFIPEADSLEFGKSIIDFAVETYGADPVFLSSINDHVSIRILADAKKYNDRLNSLKGGKKKVVDIQKRTGQKASRSKQTSKARQAKARQGAFSRPGGLTPEEVMALIPN